MELLRVKDLGKHFGGLTAVDGLSFQLRPGEMLGLIGPNGAGKTTVFACLSGFLRPEQGEVLLEGQTLVGLAPNRICELGLARTFQIVRPFLNISVLDNVMVGALLREKSVARARALACEVLGFVGLGHLAQSPATGLPLPLRKRLELAKALATRPKVLLLDEVMAGLNPTEVDELIAFIRRINAQGVGILLIEHVMRGVMALASRVLVINYGQLIAQGTPQEVVGNQEVIEAYLGRGLEHA